MARYSRRVLLRVLRHYREHQDHVIEALVERIDEVRNGQLQMEVWAALAKRHGSDIFERLPEFVGDSTGAGVAEVQREVQHHMSGQPTVFAPSLPRSIIEADTAAGRMLLPGHDHFITPPLVQDGTWEPAESEFMDSRLEAGMVVIDIGAHVGFHTLRAARAVGPSGRVIAFESAPENFSLLCANAERNGLRNILALPLAAAKSSGMTDLTLSVDNTGGHRAYRLEGIEPAARIRCVALDDILPADIVVNFVKVDIEGADHLALAGMRQTLLRCRPVVITEFFPEFIRYLGDDPTGVIQSYEHDGFRVGIVGHAAETVPTNPARITEWAEAQPHRYITLSLEPEPGH